MSWHRVLSPKENLRVCLLKVVLGLHRFWGKRGAAGTEMRRPKVWGVETGRKVSFPP